RAIHGAEPAGADDRLEDVGTDRLALAGAALRAHSRLPGREVSTRAPKFDPGKGLERRSLCEVGAGTLRPDARSGTEPRDRRGLHLLSFVHRDPERASGRSTRYRDPPIRVHHHRCARRVAVPPRAAARTSGYALPVM